MPGEPEDEGLPMPLQAAYSIFLGGQEEWELTLEKFTVYQYLKRAGYVVIRADENWNSIPKTSPCQQQKPSISKLVWDALWTSFFTEAKGVKWKRQSSGPLVQPGLYSDYSTLAYLLFNDEADNKEIDSIYRLLTLVPYHNPQSTPSVLPLVQASQDQDPRITYHIYKPSSPYKKSRPGPPDFYIAVINSRKSSILTEMQIEALLCQTPFHPPMKEDPNVYRKVKTGYRNVILAVVDQGIVSFVNVVDAAFGQAKLWERSTMARGSGSSSRGGAGRGRRRGK
jgi:tRNA-splicing endonuclease subunit Sen54